MKRKEHRIGPWIVTGLLGVYLAVACWYAGPLVPDTLSAALNPRALPAPQPTGPVGAVLAALAAWLLGPWLRWLLPALPFAWMPVRAARTDRAPLRAWALALLLATAIAGLLAHPSLLRAGSPPQAGGVWGSLAERALASVVGGLGSFLVLACVAAWLLLRRIPGVGDLRVPDGARLRALFGAVGRAVLTALQWLTARVGAGARWIAAHLPSPARVARRLRALGASVGAAGAALWPLRQRPAASDSDDEHLSPEAADVTPDTARAWELAEVDAEADQTAAPPTEGWATIEIEPRPSTPPSEGQSAAAALSAAGANAAIQELQRAMATTASAEDTSPAPEGIQEELFAATEGAAAQGELPQFKLSRDPAELLREQAVRGARVRQRRGQQALPTLDLLDDVPKEERGFTREVLQLNARLLLETLANYGIEGQINEIRPGPVVTTFEFEPAPGVKVSQITSRQDDLALAMRALRIRIEAPIPGKAAVGIEIPNPFPQMVTLKQVMSPLLAQEARKPLTIALGKDVEGNPFSADLAEMPHLLVAGATGSGKSVCLNALVCNLLLSNGPDRVRMLMIDPKMLELTVYNGIPQLLHPVITEAREALKALKWMVEHMSVRYSNLAKHGVRNIQDYNEKVRAGQVRDNEGRRVDEVLPYVVVIVDELADLMMMLGQELETPVARLAQMARAVGIHLVLATQRPSVNVITGVIKANFPSRIGFRVISKTDSRTILDAMGAEQLLGKGDMLFLMAGWAQPVRVHGAYLSLTECERIAAHWRALADGPARLDLDDGPGSTGLDLGDDDLLDDARRIVVMTQSGSVSLLQRRLRVGYTRAARLMDMLEERGVVGPFEGSKAREVLVGREELEAEQ